MSPSPELTWEGKYDKAGKKIGSVRVALPFQTIETINESSSERQRSLDLFTSGRDSEWRNRLIWGDKKYVLPALIAELQGQVDLIYIDPPFATGADFSFEIEIGEGRFTKQPSIIEQKAYRDTWGNGLHSYVCMVSRHGEVPSRPSLRNWDLVRPPRLEDGSLRPRRA